MKLYMLNVQSYEHLLNATRNAKRQTNAHRWLKNVWRAIAHLEAGIALQDQLNYDEPAPWYSPVRQNLGAMLLQAGRPAEAEQVFRDDLAIYPNNGWSLYGLAQSLEAQGKTGEARQARAQFRSAWQHADVTLTAARF